MRALSLGLMLGSITLPMAAFADTASPLRQLGNHPFLGSYQDACTLHVNAHGYFTMDECLSALPQVEDPSVCPNRAMLQDGTQWWMLFTKGGEHQIDHVVIAFGDDVAEDDPMRMAGDCSDVEDAQDFIFPGRCGNHSVPHQPPATNARVVDVPAKITSSVAQSLETEPTPLRRSSQLLGQTNTGVRSHTIYVQGYCVPE